MRTIAVSRIGECEAGSMDSPYRSEFLSVAVVHFLAVVAPGPEFVMVIRHSIAYGRQKGLWLSLGIGLGTLLHVAYSLLGIALLVSQSVMLFTIMKLLGAVYLAYLGITALKAQPSLPGATEDKSQPLPSLRFTLWTGFLTSALNPKATLFFLALFSVIISPATPAVVKIGYGIWMASVNTAWLATLTLVCSHAVVRRALRKVSHWCERLMGVVLIALALRLAVANFR